MGYNYIKLSVKKEVFELLLQCIEEYRKHHPEMDQVPITQNKIIYEVCSFYIKHDI